MNPSLYLSKDCFSLNQALADELSECFNTLKPRIIKIEQTKCDIHGLIKNPFIISKLIVPSEQLLQALHLFKPSCDLEIFD